MPSWSREVVKYTSWTCQVIRRNYNSCEYFYLVGTETAKDRQQYIETPQKIKQIMCGIKRNLTCLPARARSVNLLSLAGACVIRSKKLIKVYNIHHLLWVATMKRLSLTESIHWKAKAPNLVKQHVSPILGAQTVHLLYCKDNTIT